MDKAVDKFVNFKGRIMHYLICGAENEGDWVVLLHGKKYKAEDWEKAGLLGKFKDEGFKVIALDLPGFWHSEELKEELSYEEFLAEFLKQLDIPSFHLIGPSFSGEISLRFALRYPDRLKSLVLVGSVNVDKYQDKLKDIETKTLIVWGREDNVAPYEFALILKENIPDSTLQTFAELGHTCYLDDPEGFAQAVTDFFLS